MTGKLENYTFEFLGASYNFVPHIIFSTTKIILLIIYSKFAFKKQTHIPLAVHKNENNLKYDI